MPTMTRDSDMYRFGAAWLGSLRKWAEQSGGRFILVYGLLFGGFWGLGFALLVMMGAWLMPQLGWSGDVRIGLLAMLSAMTGLAWAGLMWLVLLWKSRQMEGRAN